MVYKPTDTPNQALIQIKNKTDGENLLGEVSTRCILAGFYMHIHIYMYIYILYTSQCELELKKIYKKIHNTRMFASL